MRWIAMAIALFSMTAPASAGWQFGGDDVGPFSGSAHYVVATSGKSDPTLTLWCKGSEDLYLSFNTRIPLQPYFNISLLSGPFDILLVTDDQPQVAFKAQPGALESDHLFYVIAFNSDLGSAFRSIRTAKKRVAVAIRLKDKTLFAIELPVSGNTDSVGQLMSACQIPETMEMAKTGLTAVYESIFGK